MSKDKQGDIVAERDMKPTSPTISNSKMDRYALCPRSVQLHYDEGLRPLGLSSPLLFGGAVDRGLNVLLLGGSVEEARGEFERALTFTMVNGESVHVPSSELIEYSHGDYDEAFVPVDERTGSPWNALRYKGFAMLEAYASRVMPRLSNIRHVQKPLEIENAEGHRVTGFIDFVAHVDGEGPYVLDNKTSASPYGLGRVRTSQQLSIYSVDTGISMAGYIVLIKKPRKRKLTKGEKLLLPDEPSLYEIDIQVILDKLDQDMVELVMESLRNVSDAIIEKKFPQK